MTRHIEQLAKKTGELLTQQGLTLTTAESCTGGGLSYWITSVPGSSAWFERGFVTYSDAAKLDMLGVDAEILSTYGAVSEQTAGEMAKGALRQSQAHISIAITGIAGPLGGTTLKPVGTVWIAIASSRLTAKAQLAIFTGDRNTIRFQAIEKALTNLLAHLATPH